MFSSLFAVIQLCMILCSVALSRTEHNPSFYIPKSDRAYPSCFSTDVIKLNIKCENMISIGRGNDHHTMKLFPQLRNNETGTIIREHDEDDDGPEYMYSSKIRSAYAGAHKKKLHPLLLGPGRREQGKYIPLQTASKNNLSEFTQRIMSAKLLRVKQVQNQLSETQIQLNELINENRILKTLQKRQEGALKKYEGNHAELPQLIRSHNEEIRALKASNKLIKAQLRESNSKLKERENELESLRESYNKLKKLSSEKNLLEREKLQKKAEELQKLVKDQDEKIQVLSRKLMLESKNYKHHLNIERNKHKETQRDLNNALSMISKLENQLMAKEKVGLISGGFGKLPPKREVKNLVPVTSNKSLAVKPSLSNLENVQREEGSKSKNEKSESPETDFEFLDGLTSSDDTGPTHDVLPDLNSSKKPSPETMYSEKSNSTESETAKDRTYSLKLKSPLPARSQLKATGDVESDAKDIADKINRNIESMDNLVQKNGSNVAYSKARLNSLYEELRNSVSKIEDEFKRGSKNDPEENEENETLSGGSHRRNASKRKLIEEKLKNKPSEEVKESSDDLPVTQQQKLITMTKTWNEIKDKVQEERVKVEEKMKELGVMDGNEDDNEKWVDDKEDSMDVSFISNNQNKYKTNFKVVNFANDDFIMSELRKTDKVLKRLKNEKGRENTKALGQFQASKLDNISYRAESQTAPKYLDEFQSEYQKQNLLKALKAIDVGKDGNSSSSEDGFEDQFKDRKKPDHVRKTATPVPSNKDAKNDFINGLFGHSSSRLERSNLDYKLGDTIRARNN